ncbi:amidohydrolase [Falsochrobactrum shanghaiense]|uniref:Amidohydrolase n=2 Tax=Falsochrobactrum shanghaiense TaxID=2201899 RepID=A0A316J3M9_9HYPH|nr:amidohydrolase [Falsochrobactrum shanghaiense]
MCSVTVLRAGAAVVIFLLGVQVACAAPETIFINARIFTADETMPTAQAIAVENGRILAVGEQNKVLQYKGSQTQLVDLQDRRVLPGLIDAHTHAIIGALAELSPNLEDEAMDIAVLSQKVEKWLEESNKNEEDPLVIFGANPATWSDPDSLQQMFDSNRWQEKPLVLMGSDLHTAWANRAMLEKKAGIDADFVSRLAPERRHTIGIGPDDKPNGVLIDAGVDLVTIHMPAPDDDLLLKAGQYAINNNNRYGITAWMDPAANAGPGETLFSRALASTGTGILPAYRLLSEKGQLTAHVAALLVASPQSDIADLDQLDVVRQKFQGIKNLTMPGIKIFADGVLEYPAQSAAILGNYTNSGKQGEMLLNAPGLNALVDAADERGWLVHIHALGDRAVRESLDAFEAARKKRESGVIHSITHLQLVNEKDHARFAPLNVIAVMQLHWAEVDNYLLDLVKPYISDAEFMGQYPARSLQERGAIIAGASDWPISTANPWEAMHHAMIRGGPDGGLNPEERLDVETMLLAYTRHAAQAIGLAHEIGTLTAGKQADFIVVDRDVLEVDVELLRQTKVLETYFAGKKVYESGLAPE